MVDLNLTSSSKPLLLSGKLLIMTLNRFFPKKVELQALMKYYDFNQDGGVSYEEFVSGLREPLTGRRRNML